MWVDLRPALPVGQHSRGVGKWQWRGERGKVSLFGQRRVRTLKDISQETAGGLDIHVSHVDGEPVNLVGIQPAGLLPVRGSQLRVSSLGMFYDLSAFLVRRFE